MRNLSDILNPVPRSETPEQNVDPHSHRTDYPKGHTRFASLSSPLHALALAAEEHGSPPMNSPTSPHFTGASFPRVEHRRDSTSSSGPGANQHVHPHSPLSSASNPARPENMPPPRFDQHQHQNLQGVARRLSDIADGHAIHLPPLRRSSGEDREFAGAGHSIESYSIFPHHPTSRPAEQESKDDCEVNMTDPSEVNRDATVPSPVTSPPPIENHRSPEPQQEPHVKSEFTGVTPTMTNFPSPTPTRGMSSPRLGTQTSRTNSFKDKPTESQLTPPPTQAVGALLYPSQQSAHETDPKKSFATAKMEKKVEKKGTASIVKKPARRKADTKSKDGTPLSQRSITPVSNRASKTPAPGVGRKQASATPLHSSPPPSSAGAGHEGDDDDGSTELFCICRKPDDHTWMIACDGPCEDWFHGRCVNMDEEKGKLIDKYFCPNCSANGIGETTWKRMCRLPGCGRPVRVNKSSSSKYCSDEHGKKFMRRKIAPGDRSNSEDDDGYPPRKKKKKANRSSVTSHVAQTKIVSNVNGDGKDDNISGEEGPESDHDQSHLRGGLLRPSELKVLEQSASSLPDFRRLGTPVFANGDSANGTTKEADANNTIPQKLSLIPHTLTDKVQLDNLSLQRTRLKRKRALLDGKEKFLESVKSRAKVALEELKAKDKSIKEICGYDSRLNWADDEFEAWKESPEGIAMLKNEGSGPPKLNEDVDMANSNTNGLDGQEAPSDDIKDPGRKTSELPTESMCTKKRCERHRQWYKLFTQEIAFEKDSCRVEMRQVAKEEKAVLERAQVRWLETRGEMDKEESEAKITETHEGDREAEPANDGAEKG